MAIAIYKKLLLLAALPALLLASCSKDEMTGDPGNGPDAQSGEIRFEIGFTPQTDPQTRVATDTQFESTWENGDAIGIFAVEHGKGLAASGNFIHNVKLTYDGSTWTASEGIYWPKDGTKLDFYAYYPYNDAATDPKAIAFSVPVDQCEATTGKPAYNRNDLLMAENNNNDAGFGRNDRAVSLSFTHALAMVQVNVSKSMVGDYAPDVLKVWLNGCITDGVLNLSTRTVTRPLSPASPEKIKMYPCPNDGGAPGTYAYRALVPAQEIAQGTALFRFEYGGNTLLRSELLKQPLSLVAGRAETFDMMFPFTSATVTSSVRLAELFTDEELAKITHLEVMGEMTQADFYTIRDEMKNITNLDLSGSTVVGEVIMDLSGNKHVQGNAIPVEAFEGKTSLQKFTFPSGITSLGNYAFWGCSNLTGTLNIPEGVTRISQGAFYRCSGITTLILPAYLTEIGTKAFEYCSGITTLILPAHLTKIEKEAFKNCSGIISLTIPASVTSIDSEAFNNCEKLTEITSLILEPIKVSYGDEIFGNVITDRIQLYVPSGTKVLYEWHKIWSPFKNLKELSQSSTKNN